MGYSEMWAYMIESARRKVSLDLRLDFDEMMREIFRVHYPGTRRLPEPAPEQAAAELMAEIARLRDALREAIDALKSLLFDALGVNDGDDVMPPWSFRDELIHNLSVALGDTARQNATEEARWAFSAA